MNTLDTLHNLLRAAGINNAVDRFRTGSQAVSTETINTPGEALKKAVSEGFSAGWILLDEKLVDVTGAWDEAWDTDFPLAAELVHTDGQQSLRLEQNASGWSLLTIDETDSAADSILERTSHRLIEGGTIHHQVAWSGSARLLPASARLLQIRRKKQASAS